MQNDLVDLPDALWLQVRNFTENGQVKQSKTATFRSEATLDLFVCP